MNKTELIENTFEELDKRFEFLTLRNFHHIPNQSSIKNDIDILTKKEDLPEVEKFMQDLGYKTSFDQGFRYLYGAVSHLHCMVPPKDVHFDIVGGLYYRSFSDPQIFVGGFEELEQSMWDNKLSSSGCWKYTPSTEDELTHLCSHSIFDKREVTPTYQNRIKELFSISDEDRLKMLFERSFYKVSSHLLSIIKGGDCSTLVKEYVGYSQY